MIADILQLPQVMGGDHRSKLPFLHFLCKNAFDTLAHYRIEPVKGLVTQKVLRLCAQPQQNRELLFHPFGKGADPASRFQPEAV